MLSINQLAWVANVLVSTVSGRAVGVHRPAIRCEEGSASSVRLWDWEKQMASSGLSWEEESWEDGWWDGSLFLGRDTFLKIYEAISVIFFSFSFFFFNLCVVRMRIFTITNTFSRDVQDYLVFRQQNMMFVYLRSFIGKLLACSA